ncbi:telomere-protecting terminal protein Tpg [Streptomyces sp. NPDC056486]|uniref:telomere-protecting terminal protein Tpg n=1 Tax=Streptomyces sp. NPDC056486 TaxID=3345835 RepID=UPI00367FB59F
MGKILDAFKAAFQTRDIPKTPQGRFNALMRKEKGDTARVAERLGISRRTVQRYVTGERKIAKTTVPEVLERLEKEVTRDHQPRVRARAEKEARERGLQVETRSAFGFTAAGNSTDSARVRRMAEDVPDHLIGDLFDALRDGNEDRLNELVGEALAEEYFRDHNTRASGLEVELKDIDYIELDFR